jgi:hypothetical protein
MKSFVHHWRAMLASALLAVLPGLAAAAESAAGWSLRYILATAAEKDEIASALKLLSNAPDLLNAQTCDVIAATYVEALGARRDAAELFKQFRATLGACKDAERYRTLLAVTPRGKAPDNLAAMADGAALDALRRGLVEASLAAIPEQATVEAIAKLPPRPSLDQFFAAAGNPAHVSSRERGQTPISWLRHPQMLLYWRGIGRLAYSFDVDTQSWSYRDFVFDPMGFEEFMPYRTDAALNVVPDDSTLALIRLLSGQPQAMKQALDSVYYRPDLSLEFLDTAAELLLKNHKRAVTDSSFNAYLQICRLLAVRGGTRYQGVLATVAAETYDLKLRAHAQQPIPATARPKQPAYVRGSISLDAQAAKYPSLYPQIAPIKGLPR